MSKLGPHVIRPTPEAVDWARVAPVVKALDDTTALRQSQRASVRVYRHYFAQQDVGRHGADVLTDVLAGLGSAPATHVELYNECFQRVGEGLERHVQMTREAVAYLRQHRPDLTLAAYSFSTGQPEQTDWAYLREQGYGGATCISMHCYWGEQNFTPWHALRYRTAHEWTQGDHPPFLITECGRDKVEGGKGGWIADGLSEEAYLAELLAYEQELIRDPYVIAATPFCGGPTPDWQNFTTDPISGRLAALATPLPEAPVPDIVLNVPMRTSLASPENYTPGPRAKTIGVVIHTTRGGASTVEREYIASINWFQNPAAQVSAHLIVGAGSFAEVCRSVHDDDQAWHCRTANATHLGIEICQPEPTSPITDFQYIATADAVKKWAAKYGIPLVRVMSQTVPGIVGHEDTESGKVDGKTDPGMMFDWPRFMRLVTGGTPVPTPTPPTFNRDAERDLLWKKADEWEKAGYPWMGQGLKSLVAKDKGEK